MNEAETRPTFGFSRRICRVSSFLLFLVVLQSNSTNLVNAAADKMAGTRNCNLYERVCCKSRRVSRMTQANFHFQQFCFLLVQTDAYLRSGGVLPFLKKYRDSELGTKYLNRPFSHCFLSALAKSWRLVDYPNSSGKSSIQPEDVRLS